MYGVWKGLAFHKLLIMGAFGNEVMKKATVSSQNESLFALGALKWMRKGGSTATRTYS